MAQSIILPRILLTCDDGIDAPGLKVLADVATAFAEEVWIVAPETDQSGMAQSLSLCQPLHLRKCGERRWAVRGTPSDCVALALDYLMLKPAEKPSLVLSGVNPGANIGDNCNLSATVGAAMTALMLGYPAIAISQACPSRKDVPWETTREILPLVLENILEMGWSKETVPCINIPNLPAEKIPGMRWGRQARRNLGNIKSYRRTSPHSDEYFWLGLIRQNPEPNPNSDLAILERGEVAITALSVDRSMENNKPFVLFRESENFEKELDAIVDKDNEKEALAS